MDLPCTLLQRPHHTPPLLGFSASTCRTGKARWWHAAQQQHQQHAAHRIACGALPPSERKRSDVIVNAAALELQLPSTSGALLDGVASSILPLNGANHRVGKPATPGSTTIRIAVDVDEVLGRFLHTLNTFCREAHGLDFDVSDYHVYDFATVWKCSKDESNHIVHEFFKSDHFSNGIPPIPGALESLQRMSQSYDLVVVTSRQHVIERPTLAWLESHYPGVFAEVHFGNHYALEGTSKKKSEICREVGAQVLIDDNPCYALECAAEGLHVLLYDWEDGYPWSKTTCGPTHPNITRVRDWQQVEGALHAVAGRLVGKDEA